MLIARYHHKYHENTKTKRLFITTTTIQYIKKYNVKEVRSSKQLPCVYVLLGLLVIESSEGTKLADTSKYVNLFSGPDMGDFIHFHLLNILDCHYLNAGKWQFNKCGKGCEIFESLDQ